MENKKVVPTWVSVVLLLLCAVSIGGTISMLAVMWRESALTAIICLCAVVLALIYSFMGYKKDAAKYFKAFSVVLTLLVFIQINHYMIERTPTGPNAAPHGVVEEQNDVAPIDDAMMETNGPAQVHSSFADSIGNFIKVSIPVLIFGMLFTLTIAMDIGKKKSYRLAGLSFVLSLIGAILAVVRAGTRLNGFALTMGELIAGINIEISIFILCAIYGVMIYAKYQDKAARGTT